MPTCMHGLAVAAYSINAWDDSCILLAGWHVCAFHIIQGVYHPCRYVCSALQATSNDIASKVEEAERTEQEIDAAREQYRSVAVRASLLFFCIADLAGIDPMYQYSLAWFVALFLRTVQAAPEVCKPTYVCKSLYYNTQHKQYIIYFKALFLQAPTALLQLCLRSLHANTSIMPKSRDCWQHNTSVACDDIWCTSLMHLLSLGPQQGCQQTSYKVQALKTRT